MKFIPYDRFDLVSPHEKSSLVEKLSQHIATPKRIRFSKPPQSYQGRVHGEGFSISPVLWYRNSFKPVVRGRFEPHHAGTRICVVQRLHTFVMFFMTIWLAGILSLGGLFVLAPETPAGQRLIPLAMLTLGWAIVTGPFWLEARHTKQDLMRILDASEAAT